MRQTLCLTLSLLLLVGCKPKDTTAQPKPAVTPKAGPTKILINAPAEALGKGPVHGGAVTLEGTLRQYNSNGRGKDGAAFMAGANNFFLLEADEKTLAKVGRAQFANKILLRFKPPITHDSLKALEGKKVLIEGSYDFPKDDSWDNPHNLQAPISRDPISGETKTHRPGSAGAVMITKITKKT